MRGLLSFLLGFFLMTAVLSTCAIMSKAHSHDSWIANNELKNPAGEWCCGKMDCGVMATGAVTPVPGGYEVHGTMYVEAAKKAYQIDEFVPNDQAQPSPDGTYWRCALGLDNETLAKPPPLGYGPGGLRRCFFFPPPNT